MEGERREVREGGGGVVLEREGGEGVLRPESCSSSDRSMSTRSMLGRSCVSRRRCKQNCELTGVRYSDAPMDLPALS